MTGKQMAGMSDLAFAARMLQEKYDRMDNPNTPLASKLRRTIGTLKEMDAMTNTGGEDDTEVEEE